MNSVSISDTAAARAALAGVCDGFLPEGSDFVDRCPLVRREDLPAPFDGLLAHSNHMTTTLGAFHGRAVTLRVLGERRADDHYAREILLELGPGRPVVEYGVARVNFAHASDQIRNQILEKQTPLGDILIAHNVLRTIRPRWFFQIPADSHVAKHLGAGSSVFGRVGTIYFEEQPVIELLEVVTGERA